MLLTPAACVRGAYPAALEWASKGAEYIRVLRVKAEISFKRLMQHGRQQVGRLVNYCRDMAKMADSEIVDALSAAPGRYPGRLESVFYDVAGFSGDG